MLPHHDTLIQMFGDHGPRLLASITKQLTEFAPVQTVKTEAICLYDIRFQWQVTDVINRCLEDLAKQLAAVRPLELIRCYPEVISTAPWDEGIIKLCVDYKATPEAVTALPSSYQIASDQ